MKNNIQIVSDENRTHIWRIRYKSSKYVNNMYVKRLRIYMKSLDLKEKNQ